MAVYTSTVPDVFERLVDLLAARPGLSDVRVWSSPPATDQAIGDYIWLDGTDEAEQEGTVGNRSRIEHYFIIGGIWATLSGADEESARALRRRGYAIQAEIETELRTNHTLGQLVRRAEFAGSALDQGITGDGLRQIAITFRIEIHASLPTS